MNQFIRKFSDYYKAQKKDSKNDSCVSQPNIDEQTFVQNILQKQQSQKKESPLIDYFLCNGKQDLQEQIEHERINKTHYERSNIHLNNSQSMISNDAQNNQKQESQDNKSQQIIFASFNIKQNNENNSQKPNRENYSKTSGELYQIAIQQNKQKQDNPQIQENDLISWNEQHRKNKKSYDRNIRLNSHDYNDNSSEFRSQNQQFKLQTFSELQANKKKLSQAESEKNSTVEKNNQSISNNSNLTSQISNNQQVQNKQDLANIQNINLQDKNDFDKLQSQETELQQIKNCNSLVRKSQFYYNQQKSPNQRQQQMSKSPSDLSYFSQQQFQNQRQSLMIQQKLMMNMQSKQQTTCTDQNDNASEKKSSQQSLQNIQENTQNYQTQEQQSNQQNKSKIQVNEFKTQYQKEKENLKSPIRRSIFELTPTQNKNLQRGSIFNQSSSRLQDHSISPSGFSSNQNQISPLNNSKLNSNSNINQKQTSTNFNQQYKRKINNSKINENKSEFNQIEIQIPQDSTQNIKSPIIKQLDFQEQYKSLNQIDINEKKQQIDQILKTNSPLHKQIVNNQVYIQKVQQRHSLQDNTIQLNDLIKEQQSEDSNENNSQNSKFKNIKNIENIKKKKNSSKNQSIDKKDIDDSQITHQRNISRRVTISLDNNSSQISNTNKDQSKGILKNNSEIKIKLNGSQDRFYQLEMNDEFKKRVSDCKKFLHDKGKMTKIIDPEFILQKANINGLKYCELDQFIIKQISR